MDRENDDVRAGDESEYRVVLLECCKSECGESGGELLISLTRTLLETVNCLT